MDFILEKSPWWGGFYERLISIIKNCLKKVIGKSFLNYEEISTVLIDVEQTLNSRPLTYLEEDNNKEALTPFHLLYGRNVINTESLNSDVVNGTDNTRYLRQRYTVLKQVLEHFNNRFFNEYINSLHERHCYDRKNVSDECKLRIGEIVLIKQENMPRLKWHKGRVMNFIVCQDKLIRGVTLRAINNSGKRIILKRPLQHSVPLEVRKENEPADKSSDSNINDDNTIIVNTDKELRKSRRVAAMNANLIQRLNEEG